MNKTQKEDVRQRIMACALEEFLLYGYKGSSMRSIASGAGMTVGNMYAYFSGKEDLFSQVVSPAKEAIRSLVAIDVEPIVSSPGQTIAQLTDAFVEVFSAYRSEFLILINGSAGSRYENAKESIIAFISKRMMEEYLSEVRVGVQDNRLLAMALSGAILEGVMRIINGYGGEISQLRNSIGELLTIILGNGSLLCGSYKSQRGGNEP